MIRTRADAVKSSAFIRAARTGQGGSASCEPGRTARFRSSSSACHGRARPCSNRSSTSIRRHRGGRRTALHPGEFIRSALELHTRPGPIEVPEFIRALTTEQKERLARSICAGQGLHLRSDTRYLRRQDADELERRPVHSRNPAARADSSKSAAMGWIAASPTTFIIFRARMPRLSIFTIWAAATPIMCG